MKPLTSHRHAVEVEERTVKYLSFTLGKDHYAVDVMHIRKIVEYIEPLHVPLVPSFVKGVLHLLGSVVPVIDLSVYFGSPPAEITRQTCIIIVEIHDSGRHLDIGIVVDAVSNVVEFSAKDILPAPDFSNRLRNHFVQGMSKVGERFILLLELNGIFSRDELQLVQSLKSETDVKDISEKIN
jgi:purine-binding chemotaxis protein CheW